MNHIAIDLGSRQSQVCIRNAQGEILQEVRVENFDLGTLLSQTTPGRVIVETCTEAFYVADDATARGHEVRVVPATLVKTLGVGSRKTKTDVRDARILSEVSSRIDLPSVHLPKAAMRQLKRELGLRHQLVGIRTQLINHLRGWARSYGIRILTGSAATFGGRFREALAKRPEVTETSGITRQLTVLDTVTLQIESADEEMTQRAKTDSVCQRLMTVPGVGPMTANDSSVKFSV